MKLITRGRKAATATKHFQDLHATFCQLYWPPPPYQEIAKALGDETDPDKVDAIISKYLPYQYWCNPGQCSECKLESSILIEFFQSQICYQCLNVAAWKVMLETYSHCFSPYRRPHRPIPDGQANG